MHQHIFARAEHLNILLVKCCNRRTFGLNWLWLAEIINWVIVLLSEYRNKERPYGVDAKW